MGAMEKMVMLVAVLVVLSRVEGRVLKLYGYSEDAELISDGMQKQELGVNTVSACSHEYGFLPCAENSAGYIFLIVVYQVLLVMGGMLISSGSQVLFNIFKAGNLGFIVFQILMTLPSMMLMILSGMFSSKEEAQAIVSVGVGIYAGITVFSLTIQWGVLAIRAKIDFEKKKKKIFKKKKLDDPIRILDSNTSTSNGNGRIPKDTGVAIDEGTCTIAGIMLLSLIPYAVLQLTFVFDTMSQKHIITLIALVISSLSLLLYFTYQIWNPWMKERSLEYLNSNTVVRQGFLQHIEQLGHLMNEDGTLNRDLIKKFFKERDIDGNKCIEAKELKRMVSNVFGADKTRSEKKKAVKNVLDMFDSTEKDGKITQEEFIKGFEKWVEEDAKKPASDNHENMEVQLQNLFNENKQNKGLMMDRIMAKVLKYAEGQLMKPESLITEDMRPNSDRIKELFNEFANNDKFISAYELKQLVNRVKFKSCQLDEENVTNQILKEFDSGNKGSIDEKEFVYGMEKYLYKAIQVARTSEMDEANIIEKYEKIMWSGEGYGKWDFFKSLVQVLLGIGILTFLGKPLTANILQISNAWGLPSFIISFVVVPLAMNGRLIVAAVIPNSNKPDKDASTTFSEIYGAVIMNNISGLTTLLVIVYAKDLTWDFTAEVMTILVACGTIGTLAFFRTTYQFWTCIIAFLLYPLSLALFYFVQVFLRWN